MRPEVMKGLEEILGDASDISLNAPKPNPPKIKKPKRRVTTKNLDSGKLIPALISSPTADDFAKDLD